MPPKVALAVVIIGDAFRASYARFIRDSHVQYAAKHGYEFVEVTEWVGPPHDAIVSLQKLRVLNLSWAKAFDYVIVLDADVFVMPHAPAIHPLFSTLGVRVGGVNEYTQPTGRYEDRVTLQQFLGYEDSPSAYYTLANLQLVTRVVINTGMLVFQPALHTALVDEIYVHYARASLTHPRGFHFEQAAVSFELLVRDIWAPLPSAWNALWNQHRDYDRYLGFSSQLREFASKNYFIHLAGGDAKHLNGVKDLI